MQSWNYIRLFEGNREADVAPNENELDTPGLYISVLIPLFLKFTVPKILFCYFFLQITFFLQGFTWVLLFAQTLLKLLCFPFESDRFHCSSYLLPWKEQPTCFVTPYPNRWPGPITLTCLKAREYTGWSATIPSLSLSSKSWARKTQFKLWQVHHLEVPIGWGEGIVETVLQRGARQGSSWAKTEASETMQTRERWKKCILSSQVTA